MYQVWVAGEVLIDLIPDSKELKPVVGGGPANTAKALAKLGVRTQFINGISNMVELISLGFEFEIKFVNNFPAI